MGMWAVDGGGQDVFLPLAITWYFVQFRVTEPIPDVSIYFWNTCGKAGFHGIQALNFQMDMIGEREPRLAMCLSWRELQQIGDCSRR
jgi:hypothetical protein